MVEIPSVIGVEDGSFTPSRRKMRQECPLCAVQMRYRTIEDIRIVSIAVDGLDATSKLCAMLKDRDFEAAILGGITFAGFNVVNVQKLSRTVSRPVIVYMRDKPDNAAVMRALLEHFSDGVARWEWIESAGPVYESGSQGKRAVYFEVVGAEPDWADRVLRRCAFLCGSPEPVRVASMVAKALSIRDH